jgi:hypothetical protein
MVMWKREVHNHVFSWPHGILKRFHHLVSYVQSLRNIPHFPSWWPPDLQKSLNHLSSIRWSPLLDSTRFFGSYNQVWHWRHWSLGRKWTYHTRPRIDERQDHLRNYNWQRKRKCSEKNLFSTTFLITNPHGLLWKWTEAPSARSQQLTLELWHGQS